MSNRRKYDGGAERRMVQCVQDKPTERGVVLNNVLTAILGIVMTAVWSTVSDMEKGISNIAGNQKAINVLMTVYGEDIDELQDEVKRIQIELEKHRKAFIQLHRDK